MVPAAEQDSTLLSLPTLLAVRIFHKRGCILAGLCLKKEVFSSTTLEYQHHYFCRLLVYSRLLKVFSGKFAEKGWFG